ncbi:MAG: stage II sporulation protein M [Pirellulales bacterium]|nr:stage II sporulation protein M [Pirellulales bacterium]
MKVSDLVKARQANWQELEKLCFRLEGRSRVRVAARTAGRFAALYRGACADLALADSYQLPGSTVQYLHELVGRAHNQLYRSRVFDTAGWAQRLLVEVPQQLFHDRALRLAFVIFWGLFLLSAFLAYARPDFALAVVGQEQLTQFEEMYANPINGRESQDDWEMLGRYISRNPSIGLLCFAMGLLLGIGGLFTLIINATSIGCVFGHMATTPQAENFYEFVTAHGPYELTAVVLSAGAGMRLGFAILQTGGLSRMDSLRRAGRETLPMAMTAVVLFILAALIEGFVSPSSLPYWVKAAVSIFSASTLMFYFVILGYPKEQAGAIGSDADRHP